MSLAKFNRFVSKVTIEGAEGVCDATFSVQMQGLITSVVFFFFFFAKRFINPFKTML